MKPTRPHWQQPILLGFAAALAFAAAGLAGTNGVVGGDGLAGTVHSIAPAGLPGTVADTADAPDLTPLVDCANCPSLAVNTFTFSCGLTETSRLFRDGIQSNCPNKAYPGDTAGSFCYAHLDYYNTGEAACIRVLFDPDAGASPCGSNAHAKLYAPSYDPLNPSVGYLGDVGSSQKQNFRAEVPAESPFSVVLENTSSQSACSFSYQVVNVPCQTEPDEFVGDFTGPTSGVQNGRLFRDAIPSTCGNKAYPGLFNAGTPYNYEVATGFNFSADDLCYEIEFNPNQCPNPCGTNAHASIHSPLYDPTDMSVGFLGDVGSSAQQSFYATIPAGASFQVAVTNTSAQAVCNYSLRGKPSIFGDGFNYGDTLSWSAVQP